MWWVIQNSKGVNSYIQFGRRCTYVHVFCIDYSFQPKRFHSPLSSGSSVVKLLVYFKYYIHQPRWRQYFISGALSHNVLVYYISEVKCSLNIIVNIIIYYMFREQSIPQLYTYWYLVQKYCSFYYIIYVSHQQYKKYCYFYFDKLCFNSHLDSASKVIKGLRYRYEIISYY